MDIQKKININIRKILEQSRYIAVAGLSDSPIKPSNQVSRYMQDMGYRIIPVNPKYDHILGEKCYTDLRSVPVAIDIVNIFRNPDHVYPIVEQAVALRPRAIWMQSGVINESAARLAIEHGIDVIMDRCIMIEHLRYF